ncbi:MAG: hypothetical protein NTZ21_09475 [Actinobacteria bacterium]|nr:hypothetical protein [Actinomycetota bacterium]
MRTAPTRTVVTALAVSMLASVVAFVAPTQAAPATPAAVADTSRGWDADDLAAAQAALLDARGAAPTRTELVTTNRRIETIVGLSDFIGDTTDPRADILSAGANSTADGLTAFVTTVREYDSPYSANWNIGATASIWSVDTNFDQLPNFDAIFMTVEGVPMGGVFDTANNLRCLADIAWDPVNRWYGIVFPTACMGIGSAYQWYARMLYENVSTGIQHWDDAPDTTWSPVTPNDAAGSLPPPPPPTPPTPPSSGACTPSSPAAAGAPVDGFTSLQPARLLDTRTGMSTIDCQFAGIGARAAGSTIELPVAGRGGAPFGAQAAVLNVTVTDASAAGFVTVYPCGTARPVASSLNYTAGATVANAVFAAIGVTGSVCIYTMANAHVIVDINGSYLTSSSFRSLNPTRVFDSRERGPVLASGTVTRVAIGTGGAPSNASAAVLNVTVTGAGGAGFVTVFPCGFPMPLASNLNFVTDSTVPNAVVSMVGPGGEVCLYNSAPTHLVVDLNGYYGASSGFVSVVPGRVLDTRPGATTVDAIGSNGGLRSPGSITEVVVAGRGGVPANASSVVLNVTVTEAQAAGFVTVFPCGTARPNASNINTPAGATVPNAVVAQVGVGGKVCLFTMSAAHLIVDVNGFYPGV